jgi:hypothetical protein
MTNAYIHMNFSPSQGMSAKEVSDEALKDFIWGLESSDKVTEVPMRAASDAIAGSIFELFSVESEEDSVCIKAGGAESHVVTQESDYLNSLFYVIDRENERGWVVEDDFSHDYIPTLVHTAAPSDTRDDVEAEIEYWFEDGQKTIARYKPDPVDRFDEEPVNITHLTLTNGSGVPFTWEAKLDDGRYASIRCRSGSVTVRATTENPDSVFETETLVFKAFVGDEFPGTFLHEEEILSLVSSVSYINFSSPISEMPEIPDDEMERLYYSLGETIKRLK